MLPAGSQPPFFGTYSSEFVMLLASTVRTSRLGSKVQVSPLFLSALQVPVMIQKQVLVGRDRACGFCLATRRIEQILPI